MYFLMSLNRLNKNSFSNILCFIMFRLFIQASADDIPQVRKVAAIVLNDLIKLMPKFPEAELLNIFGKFFKDE